MSRRRTAPREVPGTLRMSVECDGTRSHPVRRIAKVRAVPRPDLPAGYAVRVEYVAAAQDPEESDYMMPVRADHMTRRFVCSTCGRDVPMRDEHLIELTRTLHALGRRVVRLRETSSANLRKE